MSAENQARKVNITTATLRSLRAGNNDYYIRDAQQRGFQIKVPPSGNASYQVEARLGGTGRVKKFKLGNVRDISLDDARARAKTALDMIRSGTDPLQAKRAQLHEGKTLRQVIEDYYASRPLKPRTKEDYEIIAAKRFSSWLDKRVSDLTKHEIRDWYIQGRATPTQTEQAYKFLNALMTFSMGLEIINQNPCSLVTNAGMRYSIKTRTSHIEVNSDIGKFFKALIDCKYHRDSEKVARDIIVLCLLTGLRSVEARTLQWKNVDFERRFFVVPDTKNRRDHIVPLTSLSYAMFLYRYENSEGSEYVFRQKGETKTGHIVDFQKTLTKICVTAKIPVVTPHDLRRTFATVLNSLNVGYADLKQLMNHKAQDITAGVYIQPDIRKLQGLLVKVEKYYDGKIPFFEPGQGCSIYGSNILRFAVYGRGEPIPEPIDNPAEEDPDWIEQAEREFWEG